MRLEDSQRRVWSMKVVIQDNLGCVSINCKRKGEGKRTWEKRSSRSESLIMTNCTIVE